MKLGNDKLVAIALTQAIIYSILWLTNDYVATILSFTFASIACATLIISFIADRLEYSGVARWYYYILILSTLIPLLLAALFWTLKSGQLDWMNPIF